VFDVREISWRGNVNISTSINPKMRKVKDRVPYYNDLGISVCRPAKSAAVMEGGRGTMFFKPY